MAITFRGRDLVVRFKENELNGAERAYQLRYQCATNMVVHNVDVNDFYEQDPASQLRRYVDTLRYDENLANGLTRSPVVSMRTQNANGVYSAWQNIDATNPLPVLAGTPLIEPTLTGVQVRVVQPDDDDLVGFAVWVSDKPGVPMTEGYLRHQGASTSIDIPLASDDTYYMRIAPYDAFGLDPAAAFPEMPIKRRPLGNELVNSPPWRQLPNLVGELISKPIDELSALHIEYGAAQFGVSQALSKENKVAIRELGTYVDEQGAIVAKDLVQLTSRVGVSEAGLIEIKRTVADADKALSEEITQKVANLGRDVSAWQLGEIRVRSTKDTALAEDISAMGVRITKEVGDIKTDYTGQFTNIRKLVVDSTAGTIKAEDLDRIDLRLTKAIGDEITTREVAISNAREAWIEGDRVVAQTVNELGSRVTNEIDGVKSTTEAAIRDGLKTVVDETGATAEAVRQLSSSVEGVVGPNGQIALINGVIQTIQKTQADDNGARALETKNLQSRLDNFNGASLEQQFSTYANKVDGVGASYVLKVNTIQDGVLYVAGGGIAIENGVSAIAWQADSFRISTPGSTPKQVFYADAQGVYMPDVRVNKLMANSITINEIAPGLSRSPRYTAPDVMIPSYEVTIIETPFFSVGFNNDATGATENGSSLAIVSFTHDGSQVVDTAAIISVYVDTGAGYQVQRTSKSGIATKDGNTVWTLKFTDSIAITASGAARVKITGQGVPFGNSPRNSGTYARQPEISILSIGR